MYGTYSSQSSNTKTASLAAACGFAAVVAVAGLVGYGAQPTALYSAAAVRPASQIAVGSAPLSALPRTLVVPASAAQAVANEEVYNPIYSTTAAQSAGNFWPVAMGMTAMTALVSFVLRKKATNVTQPLAMAATSGERLVWIPGATPPAHLTGQYPGDRGFDPMGLSKDPKTFERMRISEVFHGRLAMLGIVGCVVPEAFFHKAAWFELGDYDMTRFGLIAMQIIAPLEYWRGNGGFKWDGNDSGDRSYPGFDPLGLTTEDTKLREIKNGRLAMLGMAGLEVQSHITGQSPLANLAAHAAHPLSNNLFSSVAMFGATGQKADRPLWFPGSSYSPAWLTGEFPGDRGFDPAGLAADPKVYERMRRSEVFHCRLAMLAIVGSVIQEYLGKGAWYEGADNAGVGEEQVRIAVLAIGLPEVFRGIGGFSKGTMDKSYPGFDPLNLTTEYTKEAEIKNGRLAMMAMGGLEAQHHITGKSPLTNLVEHYHHPLANNIAASLSHPWPIAMFAASGHKDGVWFPGATPAPHLTGEYPADRGFDPLNLAADPAVYARMRLSEVFHGRLAMFGVVGCLLPELLGKGAWFAAGDTVDGTQLGLITMAIAAPTEYWRSQGGFGWDKGTMDRSYPGFDPLKLTNDRNKAAEIKNGRLAMTAIAGFAAQAKLTGQSPLANLAAHLADPVGANIITSHQSALAMF